ncbi:MAG: right-handed parallel beta-helix repeat-containing protein [Bacteroidota bacterium]
MINFIRPLTDVLSYYQKLLIIALCLLSLNTVAQPKVYRNRTFDQNERFLLRREDSGTKFINCTFKNYQVASYVVAIDGATDILFERCTFKNIQGVKVGNDTHAIACGRRGQRVTIKRCKFIHIAADGIQMGHRGEDIRDWIIENNTFVNCGENGVDIKTVHGRVLVQNNSFSEHQGCPGGGLGCTGGSGMGIVIHYGARGVRVEKNRFFNNQIGLGVFVNDGKIPQNIKIFNNFFYQNNKGLLIHRAKGISVYHNTFVNHADRHISVTQGVGSWFSYKNNLLVGSGIPHKPYPGQGNMSIPKVKDAKFANASTHFYRLGSNSPAINAAVSIGGVTSDWEGDSRPQAGKFDVGADERVFATQSPSSPPITETPRLNYYYYQGRWKSLPNFSQLSVRREGTVNNFSLEERLRDNEFGFVFEGYIRISETGDYRFYTTSDDGSQLFIGETKVVENNGLHAKRERSGTISLTAGWHPIRVLYFERFGRNTLEVSYQGPGVSKQLIPDEVLATEPGSSSRKQLSVSKLSSANVLLNEATNIFPESTVIVYPNPAHKILYISVPNTDEDTAPGSFQLFNSEGKEVVKQINLEGGVSKLDLSKYKLPPGAYHLRIYHSDNSSETIKLLLE